MCFPAQDISNWKALRSSNYAKLFKINKARLFYNTKSLLISGSSKQLDIMIKKYSLYFQILLFGKLLYCSGNNRFSFNDIMKIRFIQIFLKESGIKFVGYYGNANLKLKHIQWTINRQTSSFWLSTIKPWSCKKIPFMMVSSTLNQ